MGNFSLLGGIDQGSRFRAVSNAGHILLSAPRVEPVDFEENLDDKRRSELDAEIAEETVFSISRNHCPDQLLSPVPPDESARW